MTGSVSATAVSSVMVVGSSVAADVAVPSVMSSASDVVTSWKSAISGVSREAMALTAFTASLCCSVSATISWARASVGVSALRASICAFSSPARARKVGSSAVSMSNSTASVGSSGVSPVLGVSLMVGMLLVLKRWGFSLAPEPVGPPDPLHPGALWFGGERARWAFHGRTRKGPEPLMDSGVPGRGPWSDGVNAR